MWVRDQSNDACSRPVPEREELADAFTAWLGRVQAWHYWGCLTFATCTSLARAAALARRFMRTTCFYVPGGLPHCWVAEPHRAGGAHVHLVLGGAPSVTVSGLSSYWSRYGHAHLRRFRPEQAGLRYLGWKLADPSLPAGFEFRRWLPPEDRGGFRRFAQRCRG